MRPLTYLMPKAMVPVGDKPILQHIIEYLKRNKIIDIIVATAYHGQQIEEYFGDGSDFGVGIQYARAKRPLGTGGQLKTAEDFVHDTFLTLNGDILVDVNVQDLIRFHAEKSPTATIAIRHYSLPVRYGVVQLDETQRITRWEEKPELKFQVNVGLYVFEPKIFKFIPKGQSTSLEREVFPTLIKAGERVEGYLADTEYFDISDLESLEKVDRLFLAKFTT